MKKITNPTRLVRVLRTIRDSELPPTMQEIMCNADIPSTSMVSYYLDRLEELGFIRRVHGTARGIVLLDKNDSPPTDGRTA